MPREPISFPVRCTSCHTELGSPVVCEACRTLQPVSQQVDLFELLQLPVTYRLDEERLETVYLHVSRTVHPDYFSQADQDERVLSENLSARINDAYRTLKDPVSRSEYLLRRAGGKSATEDKRVPPRLLGEVLMLREEIEQARADRRPGVVATIHQALRQRVSKSLEELARQHERLEAAQSAADDAATRQAADEIRLSLNGIRYLQNLANESGV